jgi:ribosome-associated protein
MDYVDFVVHIFSETARKFYDLERLWKSAKRLQLADLEKPARKPGAKKAAAKRPALVKSTAKSKAASRKRTPRNRKNS